MRTVPPKTTSVMIDSGKELGTGDMGGRVIRHGGDAGEPLLAGRPVDSPDG